MFDRGDRVNTPMGYGTVISKRMSAPDYIEVAAYSIFLDSKKEEMEKSPFINYSGTMFIAKDINKL